MADVTSIRGITVRPGQPRLRRLVDVLAVLVAASLPWSTSATGILVGCWLLAMLPMLDLHSLRQTVKLPVAALPLLLLAMAALGILWSEAPWLQAAQGFSQFWKLLVLPLLLIQFRRSERGLWVFGAFLLSCTLLLIVSFITVTWPRPFGWRLDPDGIPVKDRIVQSGEFVLCAFGALYLAVDRFRAGRRGLAFALAGLSAAFLANVFYVATSRTSLVVIPALLLFLGFRLFGWRGTLTLAAAGAVLAALVWTSSPLLQQRVVDISAELNAYEMGREATSAGLRIDYWTKSVGFIREAPFMGHGSGTIRQLFEKATGGAGGGWTTANPHNQTLAVGIQLGFAGILLLFALWISHFLFFRSGAGLAAWVGEAVVVQNVVSSLFNSHLFDFTQGWIYVFGVGVAGGMILRHHGQSGAGSQRPL
jgi:O-antigen ligase